MPQKMAIAHARQAERHQQTRRMDKYSIITANTEQPPAIAAASGHCGLSSVQPAFSPAFHKSQITNTGAAGAIVIHQPHDRQATETRNHCWRERRRQSRRFCAVRPAASTFSFRDGQHHQQTRMTGTAPASHLLLIATHLPPLASRSSSIMIMPDRKRQTMTAHLPQSAAGWKRSVATCAAARQTRNADGVFKTNASSTQPASSGRPCSKTVCFPLPAQPLTIKILVLPEPATIEKMATDLTDALSHQRRLPVRPEVKPHER